MFDERIALKMRLEQMHDAEERLLMQLQKERELIFNRLRELEGSDEISHAESKSQEIEHTNSTKLGQIEEVQVKSRRGRPSRRSKTTKMRDSAIEILKETETPMRGVDLRRLIESSTGFRIANKTTFMNTIEKADTNITKIGRGLYTYQK